MDNTSIIPRQTIGQMVSSYHTAVAMIRDAYSELELARRMLVDSFGQKHNEFNPLTDRWHYETPEEIVTRIQREAWKRIIDKTEIRKLMSLQDIEDLNLRLDGKAPPGKTPEPMPEIEEAAIFSILQGLAGQTSQYAERAVVEAFEYLRVYGPHWVKTHQNPGLKTNLKSRWKIGQKIILSGVVMLTSRRIEANNSRAGHAYFWQVIYQKEAKLAAVDRVFHLLDGAGVPDGYKGELLDAINTTPQVVGKGETEYFRFKCYRNENLHLEFKRMDLVDRMNQIAGNHVELGDGNV